MNVTIDYCIPSTDLHPGFRPQLDDMQSDLDSLRSKLRIAVIYGGNHNRDNAVIYRTFNPRPWKSYQTVARDVQDALQEVGFEWVTLMPDDMNLPQRLRDAGIHFAWLNTGGVQGYSPVSHTAGMLEMLGIPYVGHNPLHASTLDNKHTFKRELQAFGIPTAPFITWHPAQGLLDTGPGSRFERTFAQHHGPFVVKPISGRASLHIAVVDSLDELHEQAFEVAQQTHNTVLIEAYLPGREFCAAVCGGTLVRDDIIRRLHQPFVFSVVERLFRTGEAIFTSMDTQSITYDRVRLVDSSEPEHAQLSHLARTIYTEFNLSSLVRLDVRADAGGKLHVLEANPKPDLKRESCASTSLISVGLPQAGLSYQDLILSLLVDRLHYLFTYVPDSVRHILDLLA
ncbi:MAG: D-alanyl-alanine synthetase [Anaerolineae bacterium]|nr:D-alanyl-alanine synthetase [Anaerolineae bacterium]